MDSQNWSYLRFLWRVTRSFLFLIMLAGSASGHDPGLSAVDVRIFEAQLIASITLSRADAESMVFMDRDRDGKISPAELENARPDLQGVALLALEIKMDGNRIEPENVRARLNDSDAIELELIYAGTLGSLLTARSTLFSRLPAGHRQYFSVRDARGEKLTERVLSARADSLQIDLGKSGARRVRSTPALGFILLGVEHIVTGYDHLAFLFALLLVGGSLLSSTKIITSFTAAHSVTLAVATLNLIDVPAKIVEPMIALSVVYVGLENIFRSEPKRRWLLTFAFGLVHGFGFAAVLREMGIGSRAGGVVAPLLSFNLGVELGQIAVAAVVLPMIWNMRRRPFFESRLAPACSVFVAIIGAYWLLQRTLLGVFVSWW